MYDPYGHTCEDTGFYIKLTNSFEAMFSHVLFLLERAGELRIIFSLSPERTGELHIIILRGKSLKRLIQAH